MSPRRSVRSISAVVAVLVLSAPSNADPPFFMPLGDLPDNVWLGEPMFSTAELGLERLRLRPISH